MTRLFLATGAYSRSVTVEKEDRVCYECKALRECLVFDSSEDEYSSIVFCKECLGKFFDGFVSQSGWNNRIVED